MSTAGDDHNRDNARLNGDDDIESFTTKSRLQSLFDARDDAATAIRQASMKELQLQERGVSKKQAKHIVDKHVRENVRAYVYECEPLLRNTPSGLELYKNQPLHTVTLPTGPNTDVQVNGKSVDDGAYAVNGIKGYIEYSGATVDENKLQLTENGMSNTGDSYTLSPPRGLSESVFRALNTLLADVGIGLEAEIDEDEDEWSI
jgi:hypothetical protein